MRYLAALLPIILIASCRGPATGPIKGVLVVYGSDVDSAELDELLDGLQIYVSTTEPEAVFDFSFVTVEDFQGDLRSRRTILYTVENRDQLPDALQPVDGIYRAFDLWANEQDVYGVVVPGFSDVSVLSGLLEKSYNGHLVNYIYGSFVATQMSSPARIDSLLTLGFSIDIPKSYHLSEWNPDAGFLQYQRRVSDQCLLILSIRWIDDDVDLSPDDAVLWRETVARRFFYDAAADSVDRSRVSIDPLEVHGLGGWRLLGMWRNPEHLNAGAFTSYVLHERNRRYLLDLEVFHEHREKEPYIREGWMIMNTFLGGE